MDIIPTWAEPVIAIVVFLVGGGTIGPWVAKRFRAGQQAELETLLAARFATISDINGFRASVQAKLEEMENKQTATLKLAQMAVDNADTALDAVNRMEDVQKYWQERLASEVLEPLREIVKEQREMGKGLAAQTALLQRLTQELDSRENPVKR
jgi:hypothetical protein